MEPTDHFYSTIVIDMAQRKQRDIEITNERKSSLHPYVSSLWKFKQSHLEHLHNMDLKSSVSRLKHYLIKDSQIKSVSNSEVPSKNSNLPGNSRFYIGKNYKILFSKMIKEVRSLLEDKVAITTLQQEPEVLSCKYLAYYFNQISEEYYFDLVMEVCGCEYDNDDERIYIEWTDFKICVENEHSLDNIFKRYTGLYKKPASGLTITIDSSEDEGKFLKEDIPSLNRFGDLCRHILKKPTYGFHLVCRVYGDQFVVPVFRSAFMDYVACKGMSLSIEKPSYSGVESRIKTFRDYLTSFDACDEDLYFKYAEAGFMMTTNSKLGMCFKCGGLVVIDPKVDPWYKHACWHPRCQFLKNEKGKEYVDRVREELREKTERTEFYELSFKIERIIDNNTGDSDSDSESDDESEHDSAWSSGSESDYFSD